MSTLDLRTILASSPLSMEGGVLVSVVPDGLAATLEPPAEQIAKLEQDNARLVAQCEQQRLMLAELGHRVKNSLSLVQAMVNQTLRGEVTVEGAREVLSARIAALGQSHAILIEERWSGATVRQVVGSALEPHGDFSAHDRLTITGPAVRLGPQQMLALSMAVHELGTNAAKYGALSVATGRVEVVWSTLRREDGRWLHLEWRETGGPAVRPPTRRGFGSKLIERALRDALDGEVTLAFDPAGVTCTVLAHLAPVARGSRGREPTQSDAAVT